MTLLHGPAVCRRAMALLLALVAVATLPVAAQSDGDGASAVADDSPATAGAPLTDDEARRLLAELPAADPAARDAQLQRQWRAAQRLERDDVLGLRLNAQWVLLSACNTAAGEAGGGAMSGLVRGFFFAGAPSVLATHWAVETASAAALSVATFKAQADGATSRAESLRQVQLSLIDTRAGGGRWAHPFYSAPYALFGDPVW
jgi:CHAT domain-containing protein